MRFVDAIRSVSTKVSVSSKRNGQRRRTCIFAAFVASCPGGVRFERPKEHQEALCVSEKCSPNHANSSQKPCWPPRGCERMPFRKSGQLHFTSWNRSYHIVLAVSPRREAYFCKKRASRLDDTHSYDFGRRRVNIAPVTSTKRLLV